GHDILPLGTAQLLFLRTPPHAAVATSVDIAQGRGFASHKGLVNAVLRRLSVEGAERIGEQDLRRRDGAGDRYCASEGGPARSDIARRCRGLARPAGRSVVADRDVTAG